MKKSRMMAALSLLAVFVSGIVVGVFGHQVYSVKSVSATLQPSTPEQWRKQYMAELTDRLKLDAGQVHQIDAIMDDTRAKVQAVKERSRPEMKAIYDQQVGKIESVLKEDQKKQYALFREERKRKIKKDRREHERK